MPKGALVPSGIVVRKTKSGTAKAHDEGMGRRKGGPLRDRHGLPAFRKAGPGPYHLTGKPAPRRVQPPGLPARAANPLELIGKDAAMACHGGEDAKARAGEGRIGLHSARRRASPKEVLDAPLGGAAQNAIRNPDERRLRKSSALRTRQQCKAHGRGGKQHERLP